jgi:hypothetical protein
MRFGITFVAALYATVASAVVVQLPTPADRPEFAALRQVSHISTSNHPMHRTDFKSQGHLDERGLGKAIKAVANGIKNAVKGPSPEGAGMIINGKKHYPPQAFASQEYQDRLKNIGPKMSERRSLDKRGLGKAIKAVANGIKNAVKGPSPEGAGMIINGKKRYPPQAFASQEYQDRLKNIGPKMSERR